MIAVAFAVAGIDGAGIAVVTVLWAVDAAFVGVAGVHGARLSIIAVHRAVLANAVLAIVLSAGVFVIARPWPVHAHGAVT